MEPVVFGKITNKVYQISTGSHAVFVLCTVSFFVIFYSKNIALLLDLRY